MIARAKQVAEVANEMTKDGRALEAQLVSRARNGDQAALRNLVDGHKDRLFAFIWRMVRDHHNAEDICQDAFLKAFASLETFSTEYRFSTWLFTIAYRVCLNRLRRKRGFTSGLDFTAMPSASEEAAEGGLESEDATRVREMVWSAVDRLSPPQRATVLLFYRHDLGCPELARVLELPVATVKSHLHRARARLKDTLEPISQPNSAEFRNRSSRAV
jgi:RNA polymerase sigma-70 factor (ECF subfamily)